MIRLLRQAALLTLLTVPAWSATLYSDGAINGGSGGAFVSGGSETTDSFSIAADANATSVSNVGLWITPQTSALLTINWLISTAPDGGGTVEGSATGASFTSDTLHNTVGTTYDVYNVSFSLGSIFLGPGTYYLELSGATTTPSGGGVAWDENGGPSTADTNGSAVVAESFEVDGNFTGTPEPATLATIGAGLGILGLLARRRKNA